MQDNENLEFFENQGVFFKDDEYFDFSDIEYENIDTLDLYETAPKCLTQLDLLVFAGYSEPLTTYIYTVTEDEERKERKISKLEYYTYQDIEYAWNYAQNKLSKSTDILSKIKTFYLKPLHFEVLENLNELEKLINMNHEKILELNLLKNRLNELSMELEKISKNEEDHHAQDPQTFIKTHNSIMKDIASLCREDWVEIEQSNSNDIAQGYSAKLKSIELSKSTYNKTANTYQLSQMAFEEAFNAVSPELSLKDFDKKIGDFLQEAQKNSWQLFYKPLAYAEYDNLVPGILEQLLEHRASKFKDKEGKPVPAFQSHYGALITYDFSRRAFKDTKINLERIKRSPISLFLKNLHLLCKRLSLWISDMRPRGPTY